MQSSRDNWSQKIEAAAQHGLTDQEIADMATAYAVSGRILDFNELNTADIASTGGPSSLSTLLSPLMLAQSGYFIPKLGVSGRPAGGLDVLAQIPGYRIDLSPNQIREILDQCGYAHFISSGVYAPLDAETFRLRQQIDAQAVPVLVIASLLSKKIAVGVKLVGLDVRVAQHGNFGNNFKEARENARRFVRAAKLLDRRAVCILTDAARPFQPFIGRGESIWALSEIFSGNADDWLQSHVEQCASMVSALTGKNTSETGEDILKAFEANLTAQGATMKGFHAKAKAVAQAHQHTITAEGSGIISYDLGELRSTLVSAQQLEPAKSMFPDTAGVRLLKQPGHSVEVGEPVMSVRMPDILRESHLALLENCVRLTSNCHTKKRDEVIDVG